MSTLSLSGCPHTSLAAEHPAAFCCGSSHTGAALQAARHIPSGTPRPALEMWKLLLHGQGWEEAAPPTGAAPGAVCRGLLHPPGRTPQPALVTAGNSDTTAATTNTSSLVTCSPVFEFLCCHGPCRTGSQYNQLSGWWLTKQPTVWLLERLWRVLLVPLGWPGSGRCACPLQDCPSIARALVLTCQQLLYHN